jgi:hypothetical protein
MMHIILPQLTAFTSISITEGPYKVDLILSLASHPALLKVAGRFCNKISRQGWQC